MSKTKKYEPATIYLEHDSRKPIKKRLKTSGFRGMWFAGTLAKLLGQGYRLVKVEGNQKDPIVKYIQKMTDQEKQKGKITLDHNEVFGIASQVTGAKIEDIRKKVDSQLDKWKSRFKGVINPNV